MAKVARARDSGGIKGAVAAVRGRVAVLLRGARARFESFDHLVRAYLRYDGQRGDRLAAAVTFFGFLSFFPLLALGFAVTGYAVAVYPQAQEQMVSAIQGMLPGITQQVDVQALADARVGAGIIGSIGLLLSGVGWIDALREALREIWLEDPTGGGNVVKKKVGAVVTLVVLGCCLVASVAVSSLATSATALVLGLVGLGGSAAASWTLKISAVAIVLLFDMVIFLVLFARLSGSKARWRQIYRGAFLGAVGFEVLKLIGTYYVPQVASNPVYGTFGLMVGLLVWINLIARWTLVAAAWTATSSPGDRPA